MTKPQHTGQRRDVGTQNRVGQVLVAKGRNRTGASNRHSNCPPALRCDEFAAWVEALVRHPASAVSSSGSHSRAKSGPAILKQRGLVSTARGNCNKPHGFAVLGIKPNSQPLVRANKYDKMTTSGDGIHIEPRHFRWRGPKGSNASSMLAGNTQRSDTQRKPNMH